MTIDVSRYDHYGGSTLLSVLGCLVSDGHERILESLSSSYDGGIPEIGPVAVAGDYLALVNEYRDLHYGGDLNALAAFDLRTGGAIPSGQPANCEPDVPGITPCEAGIDQVAVSDIDGATAAHTIVVTSDAYPNCILTERIVATDSTGTHILDRATTKAPCNGPPPVLQLSQLSISGHTLTWSHAGTPKSAQLN